MTDNSLQYDPDGQIIGLMEPSGQEEPAGQFKQLSDSDFPLTGLYLPAGQA
jgi:hypothetical protein